MLGFKLKSQSSDLPVTRQGAPCLVVWKKAFDNKRVEKRDSSSELQPLLEYSDNKTEVQYRMNFVVIQIYMENCHTCYSATANSKNLAQNNK